MQYVRSISGSVGAAWNSINPATLSGAIDVVVVEQDDGSLACSPFHIRFGKWRLLRPYEKKVEFKVNGSKQDFPMKLGEGGEAFFVFETQENVPEALQTSPLVSPAASPRLQPSAIETPRLQEPDPFELENALNGGTPGKKKAHGKSASESIPVPNVAAGRAYSDAGQMTPSRTHLDAPFSRRPLSTDVSEYRQSPKLERNVTDSDLPMARAAISNSLDSSKPLFNPPDSRQRPTSPLRARTDRSSSPPPVNTEEARTRAMNLSKKLWTSNISNQVTDSGDLMLDMTGYKSSDGEALHAEAIARQLLSEEIDGPYDIGALIGADENGNIWIYSSEEAKEAAGNKASKGLGIHGYHSADALSDPGYHSDEANDASSDTKVELSSSHYRRDSDSAVGMNSEPNSPNNAATAGDPNKNYAKTLRLTSEQLKTMDLKAGGNSMSFTVNRATCHATLWYWRHDVPIVISDIDGTITKSDVLGHVLNTIGRDWTHQGVAKLYTDIASNGYNFLYLTSRSVGQADTTRGYLDGVAQDGYRLPKGPVILSPDRTIAALRREVYLRKPEIFKMACLRDIMALFSGHGGSNNTSASADAGLHNPTRPGALGSGRGRGGSPFYAGFGNRLTDALSYRSVNIPSTRIFTINSMSEISLDLLSLNNYKTAYGTMREIVDHYFPPVGLLVKGGGEEFTDFNYWREKPLDIVDFTDSESEDEDNAIHHSLARRADSGGLKQSLLLSEDEAADEMLESSYFDGRGRMSLEESVAGESVAESEVEGEDDEGELMGSLVLDEEEEGDGDDEMEEESGDEEGSAPRTPERTPRVGQEDREATPRRSEDLVAIVTPPLIFAGLVLTLWTWKCLMMVVFQDKIIYMPNMPPFSRSETMEEYLPQCQPVDWKMQHVKSKDRTKLAVCCGSMASTSKTLDDASRTRVVICYFQGNGGSLPPRLPMLSAVLKSIAAQTYDCEITMLCLSYRGYWQSSGRATQSGIELDAQALLEHVVEHYASSGEDVKFILWGQSIGSGVATTAAASYLTRPGSAKLPISGLILETPFTSIKSMLAALYPQKWLPYRYLWPLLWNHWDSVAALNTIADAGHKPKILLLPGSKDEVVPAEEADRLERACGGLGLEYERRDVLGALHHETTTKAPGRHAIAAFIAEAGTPTSP
ncbi:lipin Ned1 [Saxophila tyrrhenica]|uniref:Lipin Ned1 n=1 Tax=Saxophila tyrrhenica TaxID=1690608 RepID=A0AAV9PEW3_9PEZI|nr:lipin Ned1 [Saxophila tyrrhenica]